ncbi:MAG: hypothetical protein ABI333_24295 [bacterium]
MGLKRKKFLVGLLAVLIVAGIGFGVYVFMFGQKHKTQFGKEHKISKKEASLIERFETQLKKCRKEVFTHKKLAYKAPSGAAESGYKKAIFAVTKEIKTCLKGQKSADGKGFSVQMQGHQLEPVAAAKTCQEFADRFYALMACETRIEALIDDAGFTDPEGVDGDTKPADGMAAKPADGMAAKPADGMAAKPADGMAAQPKDGVKAGMDAMAGEGMAAEKPKTKAAMK